jgi:hypothetical protein
MLAKQARPVAWFAPTYKMLAADWRGMKAMLAEITTHKLEQEHRLVLITGGNVDMWSLDQPDSARGRRYARVVLNEAAQVAHLQEAWEQVIRPTLADFSGDAWFGSTPRGHNYFWQLWNRGQDQAANPDWRSWKYPTASNPFILPSEIAQARGELPERVFSQEYLAEFIEGEGLVFRNIRACMTAPQTTPAKHKGHNIVIGADWGKQEDFTALALVCSTCKAEVAHDRFNKIDYSYQRKRVGAWAKGWGVSYGLVESNSIGTPILEQLQLEGMPFYGFETTAVSKPPLIESLGLAFERKECQWLDDPVWTSELEAYERKVSAVTGRSSYGAPEGLHDDTVIARALAWRAALQAGIGSVAFEA